LAAVAARQIATVRPCSGFAREFLTTGVWPVPPGVRLAYVITCTRYWTSPGCGRCKRKDGLDAPGKTLEGGTTPIAPAPRGQQRRLDHKCFQLERLSDFRPTRAFVAHQPQSCQAARVTQRTAATFLEHPEPACEAMSGPRMTRESASASAARTSLPYRASMTTNWSRQPTATAQGSHRDDPLHTLFPGVVDFPPANVSRGGWRRTAGTIETNNRSIPDAVHANVRIPTLSRHQRPWNGLKRRAEAHRDRPHRLPWKWNTAECWNWRSYFFPNPPNLKGQMRGWPHLARNTKPHRTQPHPPPYDRLPRSWVGIRATDPSLNPVVAETPLKTCLELPDLGARRRFWWRAHRPC